MTSSFNVYYLFQCESLSFSMAMMWDDSNCPCSLLQQLSTTNVGLRLEKIILYMQRVAPPTCKNNMATYSTLNEKIV